MEITYEYVVKLITITMYTGKNRYILFPTNALYNMFLIHSFAAQTSVKCFIGIGGGFNANRIFMINVASPGFDTIAIAV